jgi:ATP-dependent DNA ligase
LRDKLDKLLVKNSHFVAFPAESRRNAQWVQPGLVAEIAFATWTADTGPDYY